MRLSVLPIVILMTQYSHAQSFRDNTIHTYGFTLLLDYYSSPIVTGEIDNGTTTSIVYEKFYGISYLTLIYQLRYNLVDISDEFSVSASAIPAFGLAESELGFGSFNLPLMLSAELGAGSNYSSSANIGGFFGTGIEYYRGVLFENDNPSYLDLEQQKDWFQPFVNVGIRYWNRKNRLKEVAIKYGFGSNSDIPGEVNFDEARSASIRLDFKTFLNY